jgi:hypothetical protein
VSVNGRLGSFDEPGRPDLPNQARNVGTSTRRSAHNLGLQPGEPRQQHPQGTTRDGEELPCDDLFLLMTNRNWKRLARL